MGQRCHACQRFFCHCLQGYHTAAAGARRHHIPATHAAGCSTRLCFLFSHAAICHSLVSRRGACEVCASSAGVTLAKGLSFDAQFFTKLLQDERCG